MKEAIKKAIAYIKGIIEDPNGGPSSKRIISVTFAILIGVAFCANLFYGLTIEDNILDAVMLITVAGLGITGMEKFAPKKPKREEDPDPYA
tara:strand:- start:15766 stop:16038 length:273 start_codon:yes stop_codon:yes gene_type:complete